MDPVWAEAEIEILVHAAAPSRASHDAYYRALASAYVDFQPARTTVLVPARDGDGGANCPSSSAEAIDSPQLSFEDVWDNAGSPRPELPQYPDAQAPAADSQSSMSVPPSEVEDSQPFHNLRLGIRSSQGTDSPPRCELHSSALPPSSPGRGDTDTSTAGLDLSSSDFGAFGDDGDHDGHDTAPSSGRADSEPLLADGARFSPLHRELLMTKSLSDVGHGRPELSHELRVARQGGLGTRLAGALEVFAPEPDGSCDDLEPSSLLTYNLVKLDSDLGLTRRFVSKRRLLQGREPRPTERGFWELACSGWDPEAKRETWGYLARYVGEGRAGWGVWLKRDGATDSIRLFSFGHVLGHMYLLLYTATRRRILSHDCTWTSGGDGLVLVPATKNGWDA
ncbi:hypothetical protein RB595_009769 [Gaeumannomyces hyphopodioides]